MEDLRKHLLQKWLKESCLLDTVSLHPMPGDASFRRYFRVELSDQSYVAMDAPTERDACKPYIAISHALRAHGLKAPEIIHEDLAHGFLLLTDFGDQQLLKALNPNNVLKLYTQALEALAVLQNCRHVEGWKVPPFTAHFMQQELVLFKEWFLETYLNLMLSAEIENMLEKLFHFLANEAAKQPQVFMHRDYHSANLMWLSNKEVGILDFQDAFYGPLTYDLVSLLRDCYIDWPEETITQLVLQYKTRLNLPVSEDEFLYWFDLMGLQRHLKALLTFSRKYARDQNKNYLQYIPRTLNYIDTISKRYPETNDFHYFLRNSVIPAHQRVSSACVE
jgi:N-acetylmuramate 1-kinase